MTNSVTFIVCWKKEGHCLQAGIWVWNPHTEKPSVILQKIYHSLLEGETMPVSR